MPQPLPRPKHPAEDYLTPNMASSDSNKKPRFDIRNPSALAADDPEPESDVFLNADEIGKRGTQAKRNAVNVDGYESDSSNEGFDDRAEKKAKKKLDMERAKKDEEMDMFADLEDDFQDDNEETGAKGKKRKDVRFLDENEIEGQVASSKSGGHVSADFTLNPKGKDRQRQDNEEAESSSDSDVDDTVRADAGTIDEEIGAGGKKTHAPKLDAFNMHQEQEEGRFDDQGNFVRKAADPDSVYDTWLEGISKKDIKKAREAAEKRDEELQRKESEDAAIPTSDILAALITHLERCETALEALARLNKSAPKKPKWQKNKNKNRRKQQEQQHNNADEMDIDSHQKLSDPAETKRRAAVESITGAADLLLSRGQTEIYDQERELLTRQYQRETGQEWVDLPVSLGEEEEKQQNNEINTSSSSTTTQWEYRWSDKRDGGEPHGPYDGPTMVSWNQAGYFGDGVEFRRVGVAANGGGEWRSDVVEFV
ncbi:MAG: hypothetical protein M1834_001731 [Cirrosporium novae-zelandiae]|nr:MAG: hypothetical protein M1834_001731 [Cirrosporium novae-zelandiae]